MVVVGFFNWLLAPRPGWHKPVNLQSLVAHGMAACVRTSATSGSTCLRLFRKRQFCLSAASWEPGNYSCSIALDVSRPSMAPPTDLPAVTEE